MRALKQLLLAILVCVVYALPSVASAQSLPSCNPSALSASWLSGGNLLRVGVGQVSNTTAVNIAVWGLANGQDDLRWQGAANLGGGQWLSDFIPVTSDTGDYAVHVYLNNENYTNVWCGALTINRTPPQCASVASAWLGQGGTLRVQASGVTNSQAVNVAVWSADGGQDDLVWQGATNAGGGTWIADFIPGTNDAGDYYAHVYMSNAGYANQFCGGVTTLRPQAATGFADPYLIGGAVRSEFSSGYGFSSNVNLWYANNGLPGIEGCLFNANDSLVFDKCPGRRGMGNMWNTGVQHREACGGSFDPIGDSWLGCLRFDSNTYFSLNSPGAVHWKIHANNDPSFDQCRKGSPGQSEFVIDPIAEPQRQGLYKVAMTPNASGRKTMHLIVNASEHDFYCPKTSQYEYSVPFLSAGAHTASNGGPLGYVHPAGNTGSDVLHFKALVMGSQPFACDANIPACNPGAHAGVLLTANWGGTRKMLFIQLYKEGSLNYGQMTHSRWNWPLADSMFWPGGEVIVLSASHLQSCGMSVPALATGVNGGIGPKQQYKFSMSSAFNCAASQLSVAALPWGSPTEIESIHWFIEASGPKGNFWVGIEDPVVRPQ